MKILHIVPSYKPAWVYGGTIESVARLCEGLANAGTEVKVFTTTANGNEELDVQMNKEHSVDGVDVIYFKRYFKDPVYISPALWKRLYRDCKNYDVVHIHSWWNMLVMAAAFICKIKKVRTVISPHGMMSDYILHHSKVILKWLSYFAIGRSLLKTSLFHATSDAEFNECKQLIRQWKGFTIPNIVWLPPLNISKQPNKNFTIIFLSRIHPKKGIELLMKAISRMDEKPVLQIAGTGEEKYIEKLKQKAKDLDIAEHIQWLGWQDREEKFETLMQADLFALTSYNENFGNVVIEALHAGTPVLISDKIGLCNFVKDHKFGWICKPDIKQIQSKLSAAIKDTAARNDIGKSAPLIMQGCFSEEKLIPEYLARYQSAFDRSV
jgi:glycosyltransferase involved in cell wall biosynthesis